MSRPEKIQSAQHQLVKHWVKLRSDRAYRYAQKRVLVMGAALVRELSERHRPVSVIATDESAVTAVSADRHYVVDQRLMKKITGLQNPDGWAAELPMPAFGIEGKPRRLLILDRLADPGNLGTLLRTAAALNWSSVFLLEDCVDPYNDKALRAAKGATFRLSLQQGTRRDLEKLTENTYRILAADLEGELASDQHPKGPVALVLGQEGGGLSPLWREQATRVTIPMADGTESLNVAVAGAILMHELK